MEFSTETAQAEQLMPEIQSTALDAAAAAVSSSSLIAALFALSSVASGDRFRRGNLNIFDLNCGGDSIEIICSKLLIRLPAGMKKEMLKVEALTLRVAKLFICDLES